jgi:hypothetical protein
MSINRILEINRLRGMREGEMRKEGEVEKFL